MDEVRVISFGPGVQSSALLLMSDRGKIPRADFAVFADTQAEPEEVSKWLKKISKAVSIPVFIATRGSIERDIIDHWRGKKKRCGQAPFYAKNPEGRREGMLRRHCTKEYKIEVVDKEIRKQLGYRPRQRMKHQVKLMMGISFDEMQRMRESMVPWKTFEYPLVDRGLTRADCLKYVQKSGVGTPPRSACYFCPYRSDAEWRHIRDNSPTEWKKAITFDKKIRRTVHESLSSEFFLHRSCVPLGAAVIDKDETQMTFLDECEGMCGL